ncbi:MerR family transcriptional regulator [Novosphingobium terrae]|jgi:DNA-binding transcriptional MerR regulator|uniref:MerR family transcriptional regulator n=1 Tax=Novosphingobium terrae TaxID=2726189 RepID=UPI00197DD4CC
MDEIAHTSGTPLPSTRGPRPASSLRGIQEVAEHLGVTHRTLRFYEDKGLIEPQRVGNTRIYAKRDVARMQLILRGKRLGFSIKEIKDFLDLYDADPQHVEQNQMLLGQVRKRIAQLEHQREAIDKTLIELRAIEAESDAYSGE